MNEDAFDISGLAGDSDLVAAVVSRDELFGLLRRTVRVPSGWAGLVIGEEGGRATVPAGDEIVAGEAHEVMFVRTGPLRVVFEPGAVSSSDGYQCDVSLALSVALSDEASDLAAFRSAVMGAARRATSSSLHDYLEDDVRRGLTCWARRHDAASLVDGREAASLARSIRQAVEASCFSAGVRLVGEAAARFTSSALKTVRAEAERTAVDRDRMALQAQLREAAAAARREDLEQVGQMLGQLQEMARAAPGVSVAELIRRFGQDQRGQLYRSLSRCAPAVRRCEALVVAAGDELIWLDPNSPQQPKRRQRIEMPGGGLRSVRLLIDTGGQPLLAAGGSTAVVLMDPASGEVRATLSWQVPDGVSVRGGVNSAALKGETVLATHSEQGVCMWPLDAPHGGRPLLTDVTRSAEVVRHVQTDGRGRVWLSIDDVVICLADDDLPTATPGRYAGSQGRITALAVADEEVYAGNELGQVVRWPIDRPEACEVVYGGGPEPCRSVSLNAAMGIKRLGLTDGSDAVKELVLSDTVVDRYVAGGDRLWQAWWSDDWIAAVNDHRNRLHVWSVGRPDAPSGTAEIGWMCSNRAQDVCMITTADAS